MSRRNTQSIFRRKGSILIAVLGLIALLSALLISFMDEAVQRIRFNGLLDEGSDLRERAYSALDVSLASIAQIGEIDDGLRSKAQGWGEPLKYAGIDLYDDCEISVTCEDETAKLPLAVMSEAQLKALFEEMDISTSDADRLTLRILDWMDANNDARLDSFDGDDYEKTTIPCKPTNAVPRSWDELLKIEGVRQLFLDENGKPTLLFDQFKSAVSLQNDGSVNVNDAGDLVLATLGNLGGFDEDKVIRTLAGDDDVRGTIDDTIMSKVSELGVGEVPLATFSTQLIRLRVVVSRGESRFQLDVLLKYKGPSSTSSTTVAQSKLSGGYDDFPADPAARLSYPFTIVQLVENRAAP
jgi:type II secretory pathway component PulK